LEGSEATLSSASFRSRRVWPATSSTKPGCPRTKASTHNKHLSVWLWLLFRCSKVAMASKRRFLTSADRAYALSVHCWSPLIDETCEELSLEQQESHLWLWGSADDQPGDILQGAALQHFAELSVEVKALSRRGRSRWRTVAMRATRWLCKPVVAVKAPCSCSWREAPLVDRVITPAIRIILMIALSMRVQHTIHHSHVNVHDEEVVNELLT